MSNKPKEYRAYEYTGDSLVYSIIEVDEILAEKDKEIDELKAKLENVQASMYADVVDANMEVMRLKEERRWRKFCEENPKEKQWIFVFVENPSKYGTYIELRRWDAGCKFDVEEQEFYELWMPLPSAPNEAK